MGKTNSRTVPKKPRKNLLVILKIYIEVVPYYCSAFLEGLVFKFKLLDSSIGFHLHIKSAIRFTTQKIALFMIKLRFRYDYE